MTTYSSQWCMLILEKRGFIRDTGNPRMFRRHGHEIVIDHDQGVKDVQTGQTFSNARQLNEYLDIVCVIDS